MREYKIAYGSGRNAKKWSNKTITWDELCKRLETTIRTPETVEEYAKMSKSERAAVKDHGGFVAGSLRGGERKLENVVVRTMLTGDVDKTPGGFIKHYKENAKYTSCLYTTHGHIPDEERVRIIVPLSRDVTPEEYAALMRYFAAEWGIDMFDECSYRPNQLMYFPTTPSNGEYIFERIDGELLDPDKVLAAHPEWTDPTQLPTSSRESSAKAVSVKKQADPLEKEGIVGAFNRAFYPISTAIERFLGSVYESTDTPDRYHFAGAHSIAGVVVYDDRFVYSHHATDPAYMKMCSAFDLVRTHLFAGFDEKNSFKEMCAWAVGIPEVRVKMNEERQAQAIKDFENLTVSADWQSQLKYMPRSKVLENSVYNELLILNNDPDFANFGFNELAGRVQVTGEVPWERPRDNPFWRDADTAQLKTLLDVKYTVFSTRNHDVAFTKAADDRRFHPIRDYLDSLPEWDGVWRVDRLLIDYFGAEDSEYVRAVSRKTFVAAVARIEHPGTKFDSVLILNGAQGIGKSTLFAKLAGNWFSDSLALTDMKDKSGAEKLQGYWIMELGELAGMKKADIETVKSFISRTDDEYRPSYGKTVESHPRQCIIVGSTNSDSGFLRDITGNRRFWPVKVSGESAKKSWQLTDDEVRQIWAECKVLYGRGEKIYLDGTTAAQAAAEQAAAMETDEREGLVRAYLDTLLPENWADMDLYRRRDWLRDVDPTHPKGTVRRTTVCNMEIWCECFGRDAATMKKSDSYEIAAIMQRIGGWEKGSRKYVKPYGLQRLYVVNHKK